MKGFLLCMMCLAAGVPSVAQEKDAAKADNAMVCRTMEDVVPEGLVSTLAVAPTFKKGGFEKYWSWVMSRAEYPKEAEVHQVEGKVVMRIIVESDGSVTPAEVLETPHPALTEAVIRIVKSSPKWKPGMALDAESGTLKPVRVMYTLSVGFKMRPQTKEPYMYRWKSQDEVRPYGSH